MKIRSGFVSNSSSSSFVINLNDFSKEMQDNILSMPNRSDELGRCTGVIKDVEHFLQMFDGEDWNIIPNSTIRQYIKEGKNIVILRESDEEMGGSFADFNVNIDEVRVKSLLEFEYH